MERREYQCMKEEMAIRETSWKIWESTWINSYLIIKVDIQQKQQKIQLKIFLQDLT